MAIQIFPEVVPGADTSFYTIPDTNRYWAATDFAPGVYSFAGTTTNDRCTVTLIDVNDSTLTTVSIAGTSAVIVTVTSTIKKVKFINRPYRVDDKTLMGSINIGITLVGEIVDPPTGFSGTITEYTTTQTVSISGTAYVFVVGGGGGSNNNTTGYNTSGGSSGALVEKFASNWSGYYTVNIGAGGAASSTGGTTTLVNAGGTVMSAGGGVGAVRAGNNDRDYYSLPANSGGDYAGFSAGGPGSNQGNSGYNPSVYPYPATYQWAKAFTVQGGVGGGGDITYSTGFGNGANGGGGYSGNANARGNGNGGGGSASSTGSAGAVWVVTGLQESI